MLLGLTIPPDFLLRVVVALVPMILSLTVHEYAHAWTAWKLGDDTASRQGRLTLSPLAHIDIFGTILIPVFSVFSSGFGLIGWARPVPISPQRFSRKISMRTGMVVTALAGPLSNLLLAVLTIALYALILRFAPQLLARLETREAGLTMLLRSMFILNIGLFLFNLFPIPPLDGSRLLPRSMDDIVAAVGPYSWIILLLIINFVPFLLAVPVALIAHFLEAVFQTRILGGWM